MWPQDPLLWECCINHLHRLPGWVQLDLGGRPLGQPPRGVSGSLPHNPQEPMAAIHSRSCQVDDSLPQQERHFLREDPVFSPQVGSTIYHLPKPFLHRDSFPEYSGHFCDPIEAKEFILDLFSPPGERRSRWQIIGWNDKMWNVYQARELKESEEFDVESKRFGAKFWEFWAIPG